MHPLRTGEERSEEMSPLTEFLSEACREDGYEGQRKKESCCFKEQLMTQKNWEEGGRAGCGVILEIAERRRW